MNTLNLRPSELARAVASSLILCSLAPLALAQTEAPAQAEKSLENVVVSVSRSQAKVEQMPLHTTVVTQEEIQRTPAQTLDQLFRTLPGLNFSGVPATQSDPTGQQTKMRGLGNAKVLVLLDGVPIMDPFYLTTQWYKVPLSTIERVEIVRGGNSSIWGNMAVAGVINIVSKRARDNSGEASVSVGSRGSSRLSLTKNWVASDAASFTLTADRLNANGYQTVLPEHQWRYAGRGTADAQNTSFRLTSFLQPAADLKGHLRVGVHEQDQDMNYAFSNAKQFSPELAGSLTKTLSDKSSLTTTAWAQYVRFDKFNGAGCYWQAAATTKCPSVDNVTPAQVNDQVVQYYTQQGIQRYREQGASLIYAKDVGTQWKDLQLGLDWRHLSASDDERFYSAPISLTELQRFSSATYGEGDQTFVGLFAQTRIAPAPSLEITLSGRYDTWKNDERVATRTTAAGVTTGGPQPDNRKSAFNPSAALRYVLTDDLALRGGVYKSFRAPGFNNMTRTYGSPSPTIANPNLGPETLFGRELGLDFARGDFSLGATYFRYDIKDMIATYRVTPANAPSLVQEICGVTLINCGTQPKFYGNDQDGQSDGLELASRWQASSTLALDASYTRTRTFLTRSVNANEIGVQMEAMPKHILNLGLAWQPAAGLRTYVQAHYVGAMNTDLTTAPVTAQGSATTVDASMSYRVSPRMELFGSVQNLFDRSYSENAYASNKPWNRTLSQPRTAYVGVKGRF